MDDKFMMRCIRCQTSEGLGMVAHRLPDGGMVGWVFACQKCAPAVYAGRIAVQYHRLRAMKMITIEQKVPTYERKAAFLVTADMSLIVKSSPMENSVLLLLGAEEAMVDANDLKAAIANALNKG